MTAAREVYADRLARHSDLIARAQVDPDAPADVRPGWVNELVGGAA